MVDEKEHDFQKKLADLQIKTGVIATLGSIMMSLGITLIQNAIRKS